MPALTRFAPPPPAPRQFVYVIRKRIKLAPEKAIFIFVDEVLPPTAALMSMIYEEHKCVPLSESRFGVVRC